MSGGTPEDYGLEPEPTSAPKTTTIKRPMNNRPSPPPTISPFANMIAAMQRIVGAWTPGKHDTKQSQKTRSFTKKQRDKKKVLRKMAARSRRVNRVKAG